MDVTFPASEREAMQRALELAQRGLLTTNPNPRVGCVLVKDGRIVGEGWHERPGEPHAEVMALRAAGAAAAGATAYVTLEPCSHHGRTPPCVDALIDARVARVVFAVQDPNPQVNGAGAERLRRAGVDVTSGLLESEAAELNAGFVKRMRSGLPWVRLKLAMSLDGRTALANGASRWISGEAAREDVQYWRARSSAVLTGVGTVLADDPRLDVRLSMVPRPPPPARVVLDTQLRTPPDARLFSLPGKTWLFTSSEDAVRRSALEARGARVVRLERGADGRMGLRQVLQALGAAEMNEVLVEAGATLAGALVQARLADELLLYIAPMLLGPQGRPLLALSELTDLAGSPRFEIIESRQVGADLRVRLRPRSD
jgi:diaminohydroxyphosphoribosylaminopyrimidine deaminase/5-amino-6-(5-phosphoribosylamino)uracil reductase